MKDAASVRTALTGDYVRGHPREAAALLEQWDVVAGASLLEHTPLAAATHLFAALTPAAVAVAGCVSRPAVVGAPRP